MEVIVTNRVGWQNLLPIVLQETGEWLSAKCGSFFNDILWLLLFVMQLFLMTAVPEWLYEYLVMKIMRSQAKRARQKLQKAQWFMIPDTFTRHSESSCYFHNYHRLLVYKIGY